MELPEIFKKTFRNYSFECLPRFLSEILQEYPYILFGNRLQNIDRRFFQIFFGFFQGNPTGILPSIKPSEIDSKMQREFFRILFKDSIGSFLEILVPFQKYHWVSSEKNLGFFKISSWKFFWKFCWDQRRISGRIPGRLRTDKLLKNFPRDL